MNLALTFTLMIFGAIAIYVVAKFIHDNYSAAGRARWAEIEAEIEADEKARLDKRNRGLRKIVCPHCTTSGHVTGHRTVVKRGISGGKATGAVLTAGLSLLATGLSRKEGVMAMSCDNCGMSWNV